MAIKNQEIDTILFVLPSLGLGGSERVMINLLKSINRQKFRLCLVVVNTTSAPLLQELPADVQVIDLGCSRVLTALPRLYSVIRKIRPRVVLSTLGYLNLSLGLIRSFLPRSTVFIARESSVPSEVIARSRWGPLWSLAYKLLYKKFDRIICQCRYMREDLVTNYHIPVEKTVVINNPLDIARIESLADKEPSANIPELVENKFFVACGRLADVKGFDLLLEAFSACHDLSYDLLIIGSGPQEQKLKDFAENLGIQQKIKFLGRQSNPFYFFKRAEALILSSRYEGFPNVVLEALACGTPVIATPAPGGTCEILEGVDGCIVSATVSSADLEKAIRRWLEQPRKKIGQKIVEKYAIEKITREYEQLFSAPYSASNS